MATTEPIRSKKQVTELAGYYLKKGQSRNYMLIVMGVHTALRISDLLRLTWDDVYDFGTNSYHRHVYIVEKKTRKPKTIALNKAVIRALRLFADTAGTRERGRFLFESNRKNRTAISRIQAYRIIRAAAEAIHMPGHVSCHSLRKTFGYHAWKRGVPAVVIMDIYNHSSFDITRRYLGVCQDDRDQVYMKMTFS